MIQVADHFRRETHAIEVLPSNQRFGQRRKIVDIAHAVCLGQELSQGASAGKAAQAVSQGMVNGKPGLVFRADDGAAVLRGPMASHFSMPRRARSRRR